MFVSLSLVLHSCCLPDHSAQLHVLAAAFYRAAVVSSCGLAVRLCAVNAVDAGVS